MKISRVLLISYSAGILTCLESNRMLVMIIIVCMNALHNTIYNFQNRHFLTQLVKQPTHVAGNILDLVFTNSRHLISEISSNKTSYSDHHQVEISTFFKSHFACMENCQRSFSNVFQTLNFFSDDVNWEELENSI